MEYDDDFTDGLFDKSLMNDDWEEFTEITNDLTDIIRENPSGSTNNTNSYFQQNADVIRNREEQQLSNQQLLNNTISTNSDGSDTAVYCSQHRPQQSLTYTEKYYSNTNTNDDFQKDTAQYEPILQLSTAACVDPNERQMNAFDYCCQFLEKLRDELGTYESVLRIMTVPAKTTDYFLNEFRLLPLANDNTNGECVLNALSQGFQTGLQLLSSFRRQPNSNHVDHTHPTSKESNEISERTITAPSEQDGDHLNRNIQAGARSTTLTENNSIDSAGIKLRLSYLLSQARSVADEYNRLQLRITAQPQEYWKTRTSNYFTEKFQSAMQDRSGIEKHHPRIKWSGRIDYNGKNLFALAQVLSYDNNPHPSNFIVPAGTKVKQLISSGKRKKPGNLRLTVDDLNIDEKIFDKKTRSILLPLSSEEYLKGETSLRVIMFRSYKANYQTTDTTEASDIGDNEELDENEMNSFIENETKKISKLRLVLCRLINEEKEQKLEYISNFVDTELIEESKSSVKAPLEITNIEELTGQRLRRDGKEVICLKLSKDSEKQGFIIRRNGILLSPHEFSGVKNQQISFRSVPRALSGLGYLMIQVSKESILETLKRNLDPHDGLFGIPLVDIKIYYEKDKDNQHVDEYSDTTVLIQWNGIGPTQSII